MHDNALQRRSGTTLRKSRKKRHMNIELCLRLLCACVSSILQAAHYGESGVMLSGLCQAAVQSPHTERCAPI